MIHSAASIIFGGSSVFDPYNISGLVLDLNADLGVSGSPVDSWANQGSAGGSFVGTTTARPTIDGAAINGKSALVWDGVDDVMTSALNWNNLLATYSDFTFFALVKFESAPATTATYYNNPTILTNPDNADVSMPYFGGTEPCVGTAYWHGGARDVRDTTHLLVDTKQIITGFYDQTNTTLSIQVDNNTPVQDLAAPQRDPVGNGILALGSTYPGSVFASFKLRRFMLYNNKITDLQIAAVKTYLAAF